MEDVTPAFQFAAEMAFSPRHRFNYPSPTFVTNVLKIVRLGNSNESECKRKCSKADGLSSLIAFVLYLPPDFEEENPLLEILQRVERMSRIALEFHLSPVKKYSLLFSQREVELHL